MVILRKLISAIKKTRPRTTGYDDHSDESETSSVCSERSMDSVNRRPEVSCPNFSVWLYNEFFFFSAITGKVGLNHHIKIFMI